MKRILAFLFLLSFLTACGTPNQVPIPVTQGPTLAPETLVAPAAPATLAVSSSINAPVVSSPGLAYIHMVDEKNGWGITDTKVVRTDDGGVTWHDVTPPNPPPLGYSAKAEFTDDVHGWLLVASTSDPNAGTMYRTSDGGLSWQSVSVPFGTGELHFIDSNNGWAMADLGAGAGSMGVAIFQTTDGGQTWTQNYINDPNQPNAGDSLPLGGIKDGMTVTDMKNAWVGGVTYTPGVVYLYQSSDAGHTWNLESAPIPAGYDQAQFETIGPMFVSPTDAFLPVHVTDQNGVMLAVYISHDGGANWALTPTLIPQGGSMDFVSISDGFVWNATSFYVTHDAAKTWTTVTPDVAFGENFAGMGFVSPTTGFVLTNDATGTRTLYKTTDGGATWNILGK